MAKDTFYFSHDYNTRNDEKIKMLIRRHGVLGYGLFWVIIEDLYNNANALRTDYEGIAYDMRVDCEIVKSIICDFGLFVFDGEVFGSLSVQKRLDERNIKSIKARESANKRWGDANAMQSQCEGNAIKERKGKEIKEIKESKEKKKFALLNFDSIKKEKIPEIQEVRRVFLQQGGTLEMADTFFAKKEAVGWHERGSPIINFSSMVPSYITNWKENKNKQNGTHKQANSTGNGIIFDKP